MFQHKIDQGALVLRHKVCTKVLVRHFAPRLLSGGTALLLGLVQPGQSHRDTVLAEIAALSDRTVTLEGKVVVLSPELHTIVVGAANHGRNRAIFSFQSGDTPVFEVIRTTVKGAITRELFKCSFIQQFSKHVTHQYCL